MEPNRSEDDTRGSYDSDSGQAGPRPRDGERGPTSTDGLLHETMRVLDLWQAALRRAISGRRAYPPYPETAVPGPHHDTGGGRRRLYRSHDERMVRGVCGGIADYTGLPVVVVRLFFVLLFFTGPWHALIPYVLLSILVPEDRATTYV
jgi:phage shock protein C